MKGEESDYVALGDDFMELADPFARWDDPNQGARSKLATKQGYAPLPGH